MPWLTDVANDLEDGASLLADVLELSDLEGLEVTEDEAERIGIEFPAGYRHHSGFYATKSIAQARETLAALDAPAAAARRKAARRRAERGGAFALFDFEELWTLAWAGFLLKHLRECNLLAGHAVIDFQDCLWGEDETAGSSCLDDVKAALGRYEGRIFEQPQGRRGYTLIGATEARVRRRRARETSFDVLKGNLKLPNWTMLTIEVRTTQESLRVELDEPLPQLRVLWVTKLLYAGEAWVVLTAPATAGIQDPVVYQLHKDFCTWPPDRLYQWRPGVHIDVDDTNEPILHYPGGSAPPRAVFALRGRYGEDDRV